MFFGMGPQIVIKFNWCTKNNGKKRKPESNRIEWNGIEWKETQPSWKRTFVCFGDGRGWQDTWMKCLLT